MLRLEDEFHYYLCLQVAKIFGHHRIVAYGKQKYSFVPHSHAILTLCAFGLLSFYLSLSVRPSY